MHSPSQRMHRAGANPASLHVRTPVLLGFCLILLCACAQRGIVPSVDATAAGRPAYAGLAIAEDADGRAVVADVIAGPAALAGLLPGDRIETASGEKTSAASLLQAIRAASPGTRIPLRVDREGRPLDLVLVVGDRETWATPIQYPARDPYAVFALRDGTDWLDEAEAAVAVAAPVAVQPAARLQRMFEELARGDSGYNRLRLNREALADPGRLVEWDRHLVAGLQPTDQATARVVPLLCEILAVDCSRIHRDPGESGRSLAAFTRSIEEANRVVREAFGLQSRTALLADLRYLLEETATKRTLVDRPDALKGIRAMQASMRVDTAALLDAFDALIVNASRLPATGGAARRNLPAPLAAMVQGDVLDYAEVDGGYVVVGGPGPNSYRMDKLYAVIDVGGDDRYVWDDAVPPESQTIVDLGGNDRYEARIGGPGAGWMGVSVLFDMDGDDTYVSALGGCGAGAFGFGLLFDAKGADSYRCDAWSIGAGIYGGGVLIDVTGSDAYVSNSLSQGVGGPAGVGLLVDGAGDDLYRASGLVRSAYGTPGSFMAFSQGVGFGIRPYDQGGFGGLIDLAGNDRYEGGEFSQGGGYFWGVGILHDASGNDFYYGSRYAQGFAAHQAAGLLVDLAGDDTYWATQAAAQGSAWDQSVAILYDASGNDFYRGEYLAQGAAAQQSRAWLVDAAGDDTYWASTEVAQGAAGDNAYHFNPADPVLSIGVVFDAGGHDRYSSGLAEGGIRIRHEPGNVDNARGNIGVAIDRLP